VFLPPLFHTKFKQNKIKIYITFIFKNIQKSEKSGKNEKMKKKEIKKGLYFCVFLINAKQTRNSTYFERALFSCLYYVELIKEKKDLFLCFLIIYLLFCIFISKACGSGHLYIAIIRES